jgi:hypothetical protein
MNADPVSSYRSSKSAVFLVDVIKRNESRLLVARLEALPATLELLQEDRTGYTSSN